MSLVSKDLIEVLTAEIEEKNTRLARGRVYFSVGFLKSGCSSNGFDFRVKKIHQNLIFHDLDQYDCVCLAVGE